jgi:hypothetical protein
VNARSGNGAGASDRRHAVVDLRRARHLPLDYDGPVLPAKTPAKG